MQIFRYLQLINLVIFPAIFVHRNILQHLFQVTLIVNSVMPSGQTRIKNLSVKVTIT